MDKILENVTAHLDRAGGEVKITLEINATGEGFDDATRRTVSENATQLGFEEQAFEE